MAGVQLSLNRGVDVNSPNENQNPTLKEASSKSHTEILPLLLDEGPDVDSSGMYNKSSTLHEASKQGHRTVVHLLRARGLTKGRCFTSSFVPLLERKGQFQMAYHCWNYATRQVLLGIPSSGLGVMKDTRLDDDHCLL